MQSRIDHPPCRDSAGLPRPAVTIQAGQGVLASPAQPQFCPLRVRPRGPEPHCSGDRGRAGSCGTSVGNGEFRVARRRPRSDRDRLVNNPHRRTGESSTKVCRTASQKPQIFWTGMTAIARRVSDGRMPGWIKQMPIAAPAFPPTRGPLQMIPTPGTVSRAMPHSPLIRAPSGTCSVAPGLTAKSRGPSLRTLGDSTGGSPAHLLGKVQSEPGIANDLQLGLEPVDP